ncbi:prephenate dehydratase [Lacrimispora saccharolytica]|uniref:Bifunctional chorismate mutase/prephenate dehydratase n=1 Tax=Lacrimispora saccharolytica (strain ATCC 35040 / DSM 2544 / NRCC 2533 / WM1) TaxID=610130 RepID=D9R3X3_LACSW|nr:prephenate dehydratase [Lacrimispora saccharolytica]ADL03086.1 Prephenate dehydratase [[Clostridium] saccharolyticum WM1]QRV22161.1 prephenate dehydratase [Lacrimispora saccharolytica]
MKTLDLQEIRKQLDGIDHEIVSLFEKRMKLSGQVAEYKIETGKQVYDKEREQEKIRAVTGMVEDEFHKQAVRELYTQVMTISRHFQYKRMAEHGLKAEHDFRPVQSLPIKQARVVYQGVEGAYSHEAALKYFGEDGNIRHVDSWEDAMKEVAAGTADYAVLPIENSSAGAVTHNYDLLIKYRNYIVAETFLSVDHALLGLSEANEEDIQTVFSHPQALMQCSEFLNANREWKQVSVENTAVAAKKVLEDGDPSQAAVASEIAGKIYGLKVLRTSINHNKNNATRFIILSKDPVYREDAGKISISFELPHKSGSLYNMLSNFIYNGVNMRMIESRPILGRNWEYRFFIDIEGNLSDASIQNALKGISEEGSNMRVLGNY